MAKKKYLSFAKGKGYQLYVFNFQGKCWIPIILSVFGLLGAISFESGELISHKCPRFAADFPNQDIDSGKKGCSDVSKEFFSSF